MWVITLSRRLVVPPLTTAFVMTNNGKLTISKAELTVMTYKQRQPEYMVVQTPLSQVQPFLALNWVKPQRRPALSQRSPVLPRHRSRSSRAM